MRHGLPAVLTDRPLIDIWSYNCAPESGGFEVFKAEAPMFWAYYSNNNQQDAIDRSLDEQGRYSTAVPRRANRAVIFNSNLLHKTNDCNFRNGYINRRPIISILFAHATITERRLTSITPPLLPLYLP